MRTNAVGIAVLLALGGLASGQQPMQESPRIAYRFSPEGEIGMSLLQAGKSIQLTFSEHGDTNSTVLRVNGADAEFGAGEWQSKPKALSKSKEGKQRFGHSDVWVHNKIKVTQVVEVLPSHTGKLDTCLVYYVLENTDKRAHQVGLRTMIDTQINRNDGNSFALAGRAVTNFADLTVKDMPNAIEVRETSDPKSFGVVAHLTLRVGGPFESPDRCSLTHWIPEAPNWEVPVAPIADDAAAVLYWNPRTLAPGARRYAAYAYGQGVMSVAK